jgi:molybdopterin converting factor small subunit
MTKRYFAFLMEIAKGSQRGIMRAETQKVVEEIEQSVGLLRRSL